MIDPNTRRLANLMDAVARRESDATDQEILDGAAAAGVDTETEASRVRGVLADAIFRTKIAGGVLRVMVERRPGLPQFGVFLGLLLDERGDTQAIVRLDHYGLMLVATHPSNVVPITPEQEAAYTP